MKKVFFAVASLFLYVSFIYSTPIIKDDNALILLSSKVLNPYKANNFMAKTLGGILKKQDGHLYVSIVTDDKINLLKIEGGVVTSTAVVSEFVGNVTLQGTIYSGMGTIVTDGSNIYAAFSAESGTGSQAAKILKTDFNGNIQWVRTYDNPGSKFAVVDADLDKSSGNFYVYAIDFGINDSTAPIKKVLKVSSGGGVETIMSAPLKPASQIGTFYYERSLVFNSGDNSINMFGYYSTNTSYNYLSGVKYSTNGSIKANKVFSDNEFIGYAFRSYEYGGNMYALWNRTNSGAKRKIIKINSNLSMAWHTNIINAYMPQDIYVDSSGVYVGFINGVDSYCSIYNDSNGTIKMSKVIKMPQNIDQQLSVNLVNSSQIGILTSHNDGIRYATLPVSTNSINVYYSGNAGFTESAISPKFTTSPTINAEYQIKYRNNVSNIKPDIGYPRVVIYKTIGDVTTNTIVVMSEANSADVNYTDGKIYNAVYAMAMDANSKYSYRIEVKASGGEFISDIMQGPFYGSNPSFLPVGGAFIQQAKTYDNTELSVKAVFVDPSSSGIKTGYPKIVVQKAIDGSEVKNATMATLETTSNGVEYEYLIGKLPIGEYKYTIKAENMIGLSAVEEGYFTVEKSIKNNKVINAPNPFNPARQSTKVQFYADKAENIRIKIYTLNGKLVFEDSFGAVVGTNEYEYKGKDENGNNLYNGVYVCVIEKSGGNAKCKIAVVK